MSIASIGGRIAAFIVIAGFAASAGAAQRTFVASTGDDANPCSVAQPCRTFAIAMAKTGVNGEVIVLDSGGYGPLTIAQSVTIAASPGVYAGISVFSGEGILVDGAAIRVVLRGLTINGQGGFYGINFVNGAELAVEDCSVAGMKSAGIWTHAANAKVSVRNTVLRDNGPNPSGIGFFAVGPQTAVLDGVRSHGNGNAGVQASAGARVNVSNSVLDHNGIYGAFSLSAGFTTEVVIAHSTVTDNLYGLGVSSSAPGFASVVSDANTITFHDTAYRFVGNNGVIRTRGNNTVGYYNTAVSGGALTPLGGL